MSNNLSELRREKGLSQSQLAELSGVNLRMIQYYEQGYKDIAKAQAETLFNLAEALECTMEDIIKGEENMKKLSSQNLTVCDNICRISNAIEKIARKYSEIYQPTKLVVEEEFVKVVRKDERTLAFLISELSTREISYQEIERIENFVCGL